MLVSAYSWFDDSTACTRCAAKHDGHKKVATAHHKSYKTAVHLPSSAKAGQCWGRVRIPAKYETKTERVMVRPASTRVVATQGKYAWTTKRVVAREASERVRVIPARYRTVKERVKVAPAQYKVVSTAARFRTVTERVMVTPARTKWIPKTTCRGPGCRPLAYKSHKSWKHSAYGKYQVTTIMCLVRVPAVYKTITKRVLVSDGSSRRVMVRPAQYSTVTKRVIDEPARVVREKVPATYKTVRVREEVVAPGERKVDVPAVYSTVTKRIQVQEEKYMWKQVVCKPGSHHTSPAVWKKKRHHYKKHRKYHRKHSRPTKSMKKADRSTVRKLQMALKRRGYNVGKVDGIYGRKTRAAMVKFQRDNRLAEGHMTFETVRRLGLASAIQARG